MRYLWMPRLVERIQAAATATATASVTTNDAYTSENNLKNNHMEVHNNLKEKMGFIEPSPPMNNDFVASYVMQSHTPDNSSTALSSSDSFGTQVSTKSDLTDYYSVPVSSNNNNTATPADYYQPSQINCITGTPGFFPPGLDFQSLDPWNLQNGDSSDNFWNVENMFFLEQHLMNDNM